MSKSISSITAAMDNHFDVIVLGTGLTESITAAALSKAGFKVAHIDPNPYYGADEASLSLDELAQWVDHHKEDNYSVTHYGELPPHARQYSVSLAPSVIPSIGPFISSLIASGVSRYGSFKLLGRVVIYDGGILKDVPQSKDDIFQSKAMSLLEKRRVTRFLMFAGGEFENSKELHGQENSPLLDFLQKKFLLSEATARAITYALGYCYFVSETTLPALHRIRDYLKASGRYGSSSFLVGYYGGSGEIAQGFCRAAAVSGGVYILGRSVTRVVSVDPVEPEYSVLTSDLPRFAVEVDDFPDRLHCRCLISSATLLPGHLRTLADIIRPSISSCSSPRPFATARCIAIVDGPINLLSDTENSGTSEASDSSLLVFPPGSLEEGSAISTVHVMTTGPGTMSAPSGKGILYISMPLRSNSIHSAETLLRPYLAAVLLLFRTEEQQKTLICSTFYMQELASSTASNSDSLAGLLAVPSLSPHTTQGVDEAAIVAEATFRKAAASLNGERQEHFNQGCKQDGFWPSLAEIQGGESNDMQW
ncbi:FAD/NAD-P-binding domain-containing protein [Suillus clintonianus]|uniref:FAD/NAD-P-binding domain-containing protein n=1 Tax=Suillus clintonianus TaxID=1904413 RepID=UPI001B867988|nr:FAD/NAD-P-binding domain-containing protein [Suillus clintonianus]KAG2139765.1 FAD/NAD-P-binding domain-containing protein [Suillus clintonianus]